MSDNTEIINYSSSKYSEHKNFLLSYIDNLIAIYFSQINEVMNSGGYNMMVFINDFNSYVKNNFNYDNLNLTVDNIKDLHDLYYKENIDIIRRDVFFKIIGLVNELNNNLDSALKLLNNLSIIEEKNSK